MFIEIETIDGYTIGYKLSAEDMQLDLSYDPEFDYEKLAHLLNSFIISHNFRKLFLQLNIVILIQYSI